MKHKKVYKIGVIGGGAWGTALANIIAKKEKVILWAKEKSVCDNINKLSENKRYLPKNADLLRVINLVYEQSEIIIREDQEQNENFLILIYVKDQDAKKEIIVEDKIKNETREYNRNEIFKFGDDLTDSLILYLERMRENFKKAS